MSRGCEGWLMAATVKSLLLRRKLMFAVAKVIYEIRARHSQNRPL
jgi:hypothetical protein